MIQALAESADELLHRAAKEHLVPRATFEHSIVLDRVAVENLIPHRDPFLFVDGVVWIDTEQHLIAARYELNRATEIFAGHLPNRPMFPGVLQVEAIAQAGLVLCAKQIYPPRPLEPILTHVLGARFMRAIEPIGCIEIVAQVIEDGLFSIVVGQCLYEGNICCAASVKMSF